MVDRGGLLGLAAIPLLALAWGRVGVSPVVQVIGFCCTFPLVAWVWQRASCPVTHAIA